LSWRATAEAEQSRLLRVVQEQGVALADKERQLEALRAELQQQLAAGASDLDARERDVRDAEARVRAQQEALRRAQERATAAEGAEAVLRSREADLAGLAARLERDAVQLAAVRSSLQVGCNQGRLGAAWPRRAGWELQGCRVLSCLRSAAGRPPAGRPQSRAAGTLPGAGRPRDGGCAGSSGVRRRNGDCHAPISSSSPLAAAAAAAAGGPGR
jgi:hypothetical protein